MIDSRSPIITAPIDEGLVKRNFRLPTGASYSIFSLPLWERPAFGNLVYGRNNRIGT